MDGLDNVVKRSAEADAGRDGAVDVSELTGFNFRVQVKLSKLEGMRKKCWTSSAICQNSGMYSMSEREQKMHLH